MCNKRDSVRVALEAILLLLYAWNSCPVPGTDISHSLVAVGREFAFPIDFSSGKHWELTSSASTVVSYSKELATRLSACREVAELLVQEQHLYHREYINTRRPDPQIYSIGNIVLLEAPFTPSLPVRWLTSCSSLSLALGELLLS
jgi:hypothetical protein